MNLSITHAGLYTSPEKMLQETTCVFLSLVLSGLEYAYICSPDGTRVETVQESSITLVPENFLLDFSFGEQRKNYTIMCRIDGLSWNKTEKALELEYNGQKINIPFMIPIPAVRKKQIQELFQRVVQLGNSALPADNMAAELLLYSVLAEFPAQVNTNAEQKIPETVLALKNAIDVDTDFRKTLTELMQAIPLTEIHLRRLFRKYFHTNPADYRARLRFSKIQHLLAETQLGFKEIADSAGMNHVSHLYLFLKKHCGMTPSELRKNLRM